MIKWLKGGIENKRGQALYKGSLTKEARVAITSVSIGGTILVVMNLIDKKDLFYMLGMISFWIFYMVIIISLQQVFIITENGIGQQSIITNGKYGLIEWNNVKGYRWDDNKLTVMYTSNNKLTTRQYKVKIDDKSIIDDIINKKVE